MIWQPKIGQRVMIRYRKGNPKGMMKLNGCVGTVCVFARGPGPRNVAVLLDPAGAGVKVIVPRGNLTLEVLGETVEK
jgi:hypothetical protein